MIKKGSWVQIKKTVLTPNERAVNLPETTKKVPLLLWVKGYLLNDSELGDKVEIKTVTGRIEAGVLITVNPFYSHSYGNFVPEILKIDEIVKSTLFGGEN